MRPRHPRNRLNRRFTADLATVNALLRHMESAEAAPNVNERSAESQQYPVSARTDDFSAELQTVRPATDEERRAFVLRWKAKLVAEMPEDDPLARALVAEELEKLAKEMEGTNGKVR